MVQHCVRVKLNAEAAVSAHRGRHPLESLGSLASTSPIKSASLLPSVLQGKRVGFPCRNTPGKSLLRSAPAQLLPASTMLQGRKEKNSIMSAVLKKGKQIASGDNPQSWVTAEQEKLFYFLSGI